MEGMAEVGLQASRSTRIIENDASICRLPVGVVKSRKSAGGIGSIVILRACQTLSPRALSGLRCARLGWVGRRQGFSSSAPVLRVSTSRQCVGCVSVSLAFAWASMVTDGVHGCVSSACVCRSRVRVACVCQCERAGCIGVCTSFFDHALCVFVSSVEPVEPPAP